MSEVILRFWNKRFCLFCTNFKVRKYSQELLIQRKCVEQLFEVMRTYPNQFLQPSASTARENGEVVTSVSCRINHWNLNVTEHGLFWFGILSEKRNLWRQKGKHYILTFHAIFYVIGQFYAKRNYFPSISTVKITFNTKISNKMIRNNR
jgi:hypothetical protein